MKICIVSDSHDNWSVLKKALAVAAEMGCEHFLFAGDFISPPGLACFSTYHGAVHMVWGNNEGEKVGFLEKIRDIDNVTHYGDVMEMTFDGVRVYMNHYPGIAENAAQTGKYDLVIFGHTHMYSEQKLENGTLLLNPGELEGYRSGVSSMAVFDTNSRNVERVDIA